MENVHLQPAPRPATADLPKALLIVESQTLHIADCSFHSRCESIETTGVHGATGGGPACIAWKFDTRDPHGGTAVIQNSTFVGDGPAFHLGSAARQVTCRNLLKIGSGPVFQLAGAPAPGERTQLSLTRTTCRRSGALLRWKLPEKVNSFGAVQVEAGDCVFDVAVGTGALFEIVGKPMQPSPLLAIRMTQPATEEGSLAETGPEIAVWIDPADGTVTPADPAQLSLEGVSTGAFRFAGKVSADPAASQVSDFEAPRRAPHAPGIDATRLPTREEPAKAPQ